MEDGPPERGTSVRWAGTGTHVVVTTGRASPRRRDVGAVTTRPWGNMTDSEDAHQPEPGTDSRAEYWLGQSVERR
jgi:hypothetical protein